MTSGTLEGRGMAVVQRMGNMIVQNENNSESTAVSKDADFQPCQLRKMMDIFFPPLIQLQTAEYNGIDIFFYLFAPDL